MDPDLSWKITSSLGEKNVSGSKGDPGQDGVGLEYHWEGTSLGIKREDENDYTYANLQGPQGEPGPQGPQGIKGEDGKTWYSGTSYPLTSTGKVGDFYLNTSTWDVFEKTGSITWTKRGNIKGPQGAQGPQGIQGPKGDKGEKGDTGTGLTYNWSGTSLGVKREDETTYQYVDLKGEKGDPGPMGPPGSSQSYVIFEKEFVSAEGQKVFSWNDGYTFPVGINAVELYINGDRQPQTSFTENTGGNGITLREGLQAGMYVLVSAKMAVVDLQGPKGESIQYTWDGTKLGIKLESESTFSFVDLKGPKGETGPQGPQGIQGPKGDTGPQGPQGPTGPKGDKGEDGKTWYTGTATPSSSLGVIGDFYLNLSTWDIYEKTASTTWALKGNIKGATGAQGPKGDKGDTGEQGPIGPKGDPGIGLQYNWSGTKLGVKREDESSFSYVDLQGPPGASVADSVEWENVLNKPGTFPPSSHSHKAITGDDTRNENLAPSEYMSSGIRFHGRAALQTEFKYVSIMGLSSFLSGTYCIVATFVPWSDKSGGYPVQIAYGNGLPCWRVGMSETTWSNWSPMINKPYQAGITAPTNKNLLWIDTN